MQTLKIEIFDDDVDDIPLDDLAIEISEGYRYKERFKWVEVKLRI